MMRYYIEYACGNFSAPIEYAEKTKEEIIDDILYYIEEGQQSPFETISEFSSEEEARKTFDKYHNDITVQKNRDQVVISYCIYNFECEDIADDN